MAINGNEKAKAQRIVEKIESGDFDDNDVDNLFMRLRAHCSDNEYFREVADFVAHNDERDKGVAVKSLEALYLSFKYFTEYVSPKKSLDISQPFPLYVKRLMKFQVGKCKEEDLRSKFNVTKQRLCSRIDSLFKDDKATKTTVVRDKIGAETLAALQHITGFIGVQSAFTQEELLAQTLSVLSKNKLTFHEGKVKDSFNKISLCILVLLHKTTFNINAHRLARCEVSCEKTAVIRGMNAVNANEGVVVVNEDFGCLDVKGFIPVLNDKGNVDVCYSLFKTDLRVDDWCDPSLFSESVENGFPYLKVDLTGDLGINQNFRIFKNP